MPVMDLTGDEWDGIRVSNYMEYPHDPYLRSLSFDRYLRREILNREGIHIPFSELPEGFREGLPDHGDSILDLGYGFRVRANNHGGKYEASPELLHRVLGSSFDEHHLSAHESNRKRAATAGTVLAFLWVMKEDGRHQPSLGKAMALEAYDRSCNLGHDLDSVGTTRTSLISYWDTYKVVAHLWAAMTLANFYPPLKEEDDLLGNPELFKIFLTLAEEMRKFAETFLPSNTRKPLPIVSPDEMWRVPDSYDLPAVAELRLSGALWAWADDFLVNDYCRKR